MSAALDVKSTSLLSPDEFSAHQSLLALCNTHEGLDLPFFVGPERQAFGSSDSFLVFDGADLIGYAHLPFVPEPEACLMIHPDHRRRGVGSALLRAMRAELPIRGLAQCVLLCDEASKSGKAFLRARGIGRQSSEFRLELDGTHVVRSRRAIPGLTIRAGGVADVAALIHIRAAAFGDEERDVVDHIERGLREKRRRFHLALLNGVPVGMLRAGEFSGIGDISAFGVLPGHQGQGIGRAMLLDAIDSLTREGHRRIAIEVATENPGALGLYKSCGFHVVSEFGFYRLIA